MSNENFEKAMDLASSPGGLSMEALTDLMLEQGQPRRDASLRAAMTLQEWREKGFLRHDEASGTWKRKR